MPKDKNFEAERKKALKEIQQAMHQRMLDTAQKLPPPADISRMSMTDTLKMQEELRWISAVHHVAIDLEKGDPLSKVFFRVSGRYRPAFKKPIQPMPGDLEASHAQDGRQSAFADVLKSLDIALRDFETSYQPMQKRDIVYWQKKHPLPPEVLTEAHKQSQRQAMEESILALKDFLGRMNPPSAGKNPSGPKP